MKIVIITTVALLIMITAIITYIIKRRHKGADLPATKIIKDAEELTFENILGEDLVLKKPGVIDDREYREITLDGVGMVLQHGGQAIVTASQTKYTLSQLHKIAPNGLFTGSVPMNELSIYKNGYFSSVKFGDPNITTHNGYLSLDTSQIYNVGPAAIIAITMQAAAIFSGQYYLVQIKKELNGLNRKLDYVIDVHEKEALGKLINSRSILLEILEKQYCDTSHIQNIQMSARVAGDILEEYLSRYNAACNYMDSYMFFRTFANSEHAIEEFNNRVNEVRYLLQICLIADRTLMESKYVEYVTQSKINADDSVLSDISRELKNLYLNGFTARTKVSIDDFCEHIVKKASKILEHGHSGWVVNRFFKEQTIQMQPILRSIEGMNKDFESIALGNYTSRANQQKKEVLLMIDKSGKTRCFEAA